MNSSIEYYNSRADKYYNDTVEADLTGIYQLFLNYIPEGGMLLDAGCGSGRDSLFFMRQGYKVLAFDASAAMVEKSSILLGQEVLLATFDSFSSEQMFDGIWACASLLHVEKQGLLASIGNLAGYLKPQGVFYMSYKYGDENYEKDGRLFSCFTEAGFNSFISVLDYLTVIEMFQTEDVRKDRPNEYWLNCILRSSR